MKKKSSLKNLLDTTKSQENNYIVQKILIQNITLMKLPLATAKRRQHIICVLIKGHLSHCLKS